MDGWMDAWVDGCWVVGDGCIELLDGWIPDPAFMAALKAYYHTSFDSRLRRQFKRVENVPWFPQIPGEAERARSARIASLGAANR